MKFYRLHPQLIRDASFVPMQNGEYEAFAFDCTNALNTLFKLSLSMYSDDMGTVFVKDSNGNDVNNRLVTSFSYEYPHINISDGLPVTGIMVITFDDGATFSTDDEHHNNFWYSIEGLEPFIIKQYT
jgi:predicted neutral ceramidase superfamily lipid hydrolase